MKTTKTMRYESEGLVFGNFWGGGKGAYQARPLAASTFEELIELNKKGIADGSLDSGMGYESLLGAMVNITITETRIIEGKIFENKEYATEFIGNLDERECEFLLNIH